MATPSWIGATAGQPQLAAQEITQECVEVRLQKPFTSALTVSGNNYDRYMAEKCYIPSCSAASRARAMCPKHYKRWAAGKDPAMPSCLEMTEAQRFWSHVDSSGDCWFWTGALNIWGYGVFGTKTISAHVWSYLNEVGPISLGLEVDHLCHDPDACDLAAKCPHRRCVRPSHLQLCTPRANVLRSNAPTALNARKTHCKWGHPFDAENTINRPSGGRACRACKTTADRVRRKRTRSTSV